MNNFFYLLIVISSFFVYADAPLIYPYSNQNGNHFNYFNQMPHDGFFFNIITDSTYFPNGYRYYKRYPTMVFINSNKLIYYEHSSHVDLLEDYDTFNFKDYLNINRYPNELQFYTSNYFDSNSIGSYTIEKNIIKFTKKILFRKIGSRSRLYETHYEGILKGKDTIINWHIVPPYPNVNPKYNNNFEEYKKPKTLYFIKSKELENSDSLFKSKCLIH